MIKSINSYLLNISQLWLRSAQNTHPSIPLHSLFCDPLLLTPRPPSPPSTLSPRIPLTAPPQELSRISTMHIKPEADGKDGRKGIIYFLVLPKALSILRVSSLHPDPKPNISLTDNSLHLSAAPRGSSWPCLHCMGVPLHCRIFSFRILQILWELSVKLIFSFPFPLQLKSRSFIKLWSQTDFFLSTWDMIK